MGLLGRISLGLLVVAVVLLATVMGGLRLAIVNIDYFKSEIDYLLARDVSEGIVFSGLSGDANRFNPILRVDNVSINLPDKSQPVFIDQLAVEFDFWASLRERAPVVLEISGQLEKLVLTRDESGRWWTHELELSPGDDETVMPEFARALMLAPRYLKLDLRRLIIQDRQTQTSYQIDGVAAQINHRNDEFHTQFSASLPDELGRRVLIKSVLDSERSEIYINSSDLQLARIAELLDLETWGLQQGTLDGEVWLSMSGYDVNAVNGNLLLKQGLLQSSPDKTPLAVDYHARFNAIGRESSWTVTSQVDRLEINGNSVPGFRTQLEITTGTEYPRISAWMDRIQVSSLPAIAGQWLPQNVNQQIASKNLQGTLRDLVLGIDLERPEDFRLSGQAVQVSSEAFDGYPGTSNLNARFLLGTRRLQASLDGEAVRLDFGDEFEAPFEFDSLKLDVVANRSETGDLVLSADNIMAQNQDTRVNGRMWLVADQAEQPFVFMRANFTDTDASSTHKYLPLKALSAETLGWLRRGIKKGFVPRGDFQLHGRLRDVRELARERAGEFFVDFDVEDTNLFFAPGWLALRNGNGKMLFHNAGYAFDLDRVSYEKLDNVRASGVIADFDEAELALEIQAQVPTADAVRVWIGSPVGEEYRDIVSNLHDLGGRVNAKIDLLIPLSDDLAQERVKVALDFENASTSAKNWGLKLAGINGRLLITEDALLARGINARYFGDPVKIDISTEKKSGDTLVNARGTIESKNLLNQLPDELTRYLDGKSDWQVGLNFASDKAPAEQAFLKINAASNLQSTALTLPLPLAKASEDVSRLSADVDFFPERILFQFSLGSELLGRGELVAEADQEFVLEAFDLALSTPLVATQRRGMNLYGSAGELEVGGWIEVITDSESTGSTLLSTLDLDFRRAYAFGRTLEEVKLELHQENKRLLGQLESTLVKGNFDAPLLPTPEDPVAVELEYLRLEKLEQESDYSAMRPSDLFDFRISSQLLVYNDMEFSDLLVDGRSVGNTLYIDNLGLRRDKIIITGEAQWDYDVASNFHLSSLTIQASGEKFGQAIAGLGFGETMQDGTLDFSGGFTWQAPLLGFSLDILHGDARMRIDDGVLNNVDPGGGRFVGLLSLSALPRRLSLDFSDVTVEGMEFEKISGNFRLDNGILFTDDTRMDGPAARLKISGKTGMIDRDYDQVIQVTPKFRQTLPVIGAIAASTTVGWGLLLLQNLFKKSIDDAVEIEYRVTGSWDDPQIDLIKAVDENQEDLPNAEK
jgi:uncharacterized protein (TIGR02099 family)